jgi:glycosyltransferase involved in cell wall biosynthesis
MGQPPIELTVAIPTMRRWKGFLEKSLPMFLNNDNIAHVVVCDETGEDVEAIQKTVWAHHPKLHLYVNEHRLGMYANKRRCVEKSPTDWVAVLDSDNLFPDEYFESLFDLWKDEGASTKTVYAASEIVRVFLKTGDSEEKTQQFTGMRITKSNWNKVLQMKGWNFLLNDGNWVGHTSVLEAWPPLPENKVKATDSIRIVKNLIENGWTYYITPGMRYIHTVHDDSEWIKTEADSTRLLATTNWRIESAEKA